MRGGSFHHDEGWAGDVALGEQITATESVMLSASDVGRLLMSIPGGSRSV